MSGANPAHATMRRSRGESTATDSARNQLTRRCEGPCISGASRACEELEHDGPEDAREDRAERGDGEEAIGGARRVGGNDEGPREREEDRQRAGGPEDRPSGP